jgi:hypothetical protein
MHAILISNWKTATHKVPKYVYQNLFHIATSLRAGWPRNRLPFSAFFIYSTMALQPFIGPWPLLLFRSLFYTDGRTPWTGDQPAARPLPTHRTTLTDNHALSVIRTHDSNVRASGHCDRLHFLQGQTLFSSPPRQTGFGAHQATYPLGTVDFYQRTMDRASSWPFTSIKCQG